MPLKEYQLSTFAQLQSMLNDLKNEGEVYILFSCTLEKHGDPRAKVCFKAEDALLEFTEFIRNSKRPLHLIYFRAQLESYYKTDAETIAMRSLRVYGAPTLIKWRGYQKLTGRQCTKMPLLSMLFEAEDLKRYPVYQPCSFFEYPEKVPPPPENQVEKNSRRKSSRISPSHGAPIDNSTPEPVEPAAA